MSQHGLYGELLNALRQKEVLMLYDFRDHHEDVWSQHDIHLDLALPRNYNLD